MNKFTIKTLVSIEDVKNMCKLDEETYPESECIPFEICKEMYEKNPFIYSAIFNGNELVGDINFLPITDECYNKIKAGKLKEPHMSKDDLLVMEPNKEYYCLFSSVIIKKSYRNTEAFFLLLSNFYKNMSRKLKVENIRIKSIIVDVVNKKMEKFVIDSGFKQVFKDENHNIYEGNIFNE